MRGRRPRSASVLALLAPTAPPAHRGAAAVHRPHGVRVGERGPLCRRHARFEQSLKRLDPCDGRSSPPRCAGSATGCPTPSQSAATFLQIAGTVGPQAARHRVRGQQAARRWPRACPPPRSTPSTTSTSAGTATASRRQARRRSSPCWAGSCTSPSRRCSPTPTAGSRARSRRSRRRAGGHLDPDVARRSSRDADALVAPLERRRPTCVAAVAPPTAARPVAPDELERPGATLAVVRRPQGHPPRRALAARGAGWPTPRRRLAGLPRPRRRCGPPRCCTTSGGSACPARCGTGRARSAPADRERVRLHPSLDRTRPAPRSRRSPRSPSSPPPTTSASTAAATTARVPRPLARRPDPGRRRRLRRGHRDRPLPSGAHSSTPRACCCARGRPRAGWTARRARPSSRRRACRGRAGVAVRPHRPRGRRAAADRARPVQPGDRRGRLVVSERTVGHHLAHVYDKTGRRTRAGAAVFAVEHGLLPG